MVALKAFLLQRRLTLFRRKGPTLRALFAGDFGDKVKIAIFQSKSALAKFGSNLVCLRPAFCRKGRFLVALKALLLHRRLALFRGKRTAKGALFPGDLRSKVQITILKRKPALSKFGCNLICLCPIFRSDLRRLVATETVRLTKSIALFFVEFAAKRPLIRRDLSVDVPDFFTLGKNILNQHVAG